MQPDGLSLDALRMPGATLTTRLKVYDTLTPDGQRGGTPHMHLMCSEMYFVLSGTGFVEMIDWNGFSRLPLSSHAALIFSPGTVHRLINPEGELELFIIMQNSGLPERGDNVVSFKNEILRDDIAYQTAMKVSSFEDAYQRRDKGVEGFLDLKAAFDKGLDEGRRSLSQFFKHATERTKELRSSWQTVIEKGPLYEAQKSLRQIENLAQGNDSYLHEASHFAISPDAYKTPGFCGALNRYFDPATLELEGVIKKGQESTRALNEVL
ncbi:MAG: cupin domain-containing protein [Trueperaceae bacterium]|nr:cupin domain-containing protein [Trueperaceae bacterium]